MSDREKVPSQFKPSKLTISMFLLSFILVSLICWRAVEVANAGREAARHDAEVAVIKADQIQAQMNCTIKILTDGVVGVLDNSIIQNEVLLASAQAGERTATLEKLKGTKSRLEEISKEVTRAKEECTS